MPQFKQGPMMTPAREPVPEFRQWELIEGGVLWAGGAGSGCSGFRAARFGFGAIGGRQAWNGGIGGGVRKGGPERQKRSPEFRAEPKS